MTKHEDRWRERLRRVRRPEPVEQQPHRGANEELEALCQNRDATIARIARMEGSGAAEADVDEQRLHLAGVLARIEDHARR